MSRLGLMQKPRSRSIYCTPGHLYLLAYWAARISKQSSGRVEAADLVQECWLNWARYQKSVRSSSRAIRSKMRKYSRRWTSRYIDELEINLREPACESCRAEETDLYVHRKRLLDAMIEGLPDNEQTVIRMKRDGIPVWLTTWAFGCTKQRIYQLQQSAMRQLTAS